MKRANVYDALVMQLSSFMGGSKTDDRAPGSNDESPDVAVELSRSSFMNARVLPLLSRKFFDI